MGETTTSGEANAMSPSSPLTAYARGSLCASFILRLCSSIVNDLGRIIVPSSASVKDNSNGCNYPGLLAKLCPMELRRRENGHGQKDITSSRPWAVMIDVDVSTHREETCVQDFWIVHVHRGCGAVSCPSGRAGPCRRNRRARNENQHQSLLCQNERRL